MGASKKLPAQQSGINLQLKAIEKKQISFKAQRNNPTLTLPLEDIRGRNLDTKKEAGASFLKKFAMKN
ncbi:hypothetical protein UA24_08495 [Marinomonas sp. BSi20414]|nr:hypothetical protein [Marinomonas sp. BSi20414]